MGAYQAFFQIGWPRSDSAAGCGKLEIKDSHLPPTPQPAPVLSRHSIGWMVNALDALSLSTFSLPPFSESVPTLSPVFPSLYPSLSILPPSPLPSRSLALSICPPPNSVVGYSFPKNSLNYFSQTCFVQLAHALIMQQSNCNVMQLVYLLWIHSLFFDFAQPNESDREKKDNSGWFITRLDFCVAE